MIERKIKIFFETKYGAKSTLSRDREPVTHLKKQVCDVCYWDFMCKMFLHLTFGLSNRHPLTRNRQATEIRLSFPGHSDGDSELSCSGLDWFLINGSAVLLGLKAGLHRRRFSSLAHSCQSTGGGKVLHDHAAITWHWSVTVATDNRLLLRQRERVCAMKHHWVTLDSSGIQQRTEAEGSDVSPMSLL